MGDNRAYKLLSIIALVIGVVGVTLGYAAFSNTLTIESSAEVTPDPTSFNVDFSSANNAVQTNDIVATLTPNNVTGFTAEDATIDNSGASSASITNLHATFTEPGQSATYSFYAYNAGEYIAYLKSITFDGTKTCTPATGTDATMVSNACNGITLSVAVGSGATAVTTSQANITGHNLAISTAEPVVVTIDYASNAARADGDFDVTFPDIVLTYSSVD